MKFNIVSTVLFLILSASFWLFNKFYLDELYLESISDSVIEEVQNSNDIEKLRKINFMQFANEERLIKDYNYMLNKAVELFSSLCFLAACFMFLPVTFQASKKHSNKSLKDGTPKSGAP